ncbi:MAG: hypothetical protein Q7S87_08935 [Agitococcus sp.]|nr:hypothetical protein [Agitococcus sp.]MDO9177025.1 hypothetical protein [Agitococcus sp.]
MHINTSIVKSLMALKGVSEESVCNIAHVTQADMQAWLYDEGKDSEDRVPFETQLEILKLLGINGEIPRNDIVHYWKLHEPLFSKPMDTYWPLQIMFKAFGKAQAVFLASDTDPVICFKSKVHFGLKFNDFLAILEVTANPLKAISFNPDILSEMSWMPDTMGVLLSADEYAGLEPGAFKVKNLQKYLSYNVEIAQWDKLREAAIEQGLRAEQVAAMLIGTTLLNAKDRIPAEIASKSSPVSAVSVATATEEPADDQALFATPVKAK